jgi:hypothetical protein
MRKHDGAGIASDAVGFRRESAERPRDPAGDQGCGDASDNRKNKPEPKDRPHDSVRRVEGDRGRTLCDDDPAKAGKIPIAAACRKAGQHVSGARLIGKRAELQKLHVDESVRRERLFADGRAGQQPSLPRKDRQFRGAVPGQSRKGCFKYVGCPLPVQDYGEHACQFSVRTAHRRSHIDEQRLLADLERAQQRGQQPGFVHVLCHYLDLTIPEPGSIGGGLSLQEAAGCCLHHAVGGHEADPSGMTDLLLQLFEEAPYDPSVTVPGVPKRIELRKQHCILETGGHAAIQAIGNGAGEFRHLGTDLCLGLPAAHVGCGGREHRHEH